MIEYKVPTPAAPACKLKTVTGTIPGVRFQTLRTNPFEILPATGGISFMPVNFTIFLRWSNSGLSQSFMIGNENSISDVLPATTGAFSVISGLGTTEIREFWFTLGCSPVQNGISNFTLAAPVVFTAQTNDPSNTFLSCPFIFAYYENIF
jgi:hypothetical protein